MCIKKLNIVNKLLIRIKIFLKKKKNNFMEISSKIWNRKNKKKNIKKK
jgi:hypothetical protein